MKGSQSLMPQSSSRRLTRQLHMARFSSCRIPVEWLQSIRPWLMPLYHSSPRPFLDSSKSLKIIKIGWHSDDSWSAFNPTAEATAAGVSHLWSSLFIFYITPLLPIRCPRFFWDLCLFHQSLDTIWTWGRPAAQQDNVLPGKCLQGFLRLARKTEVLTQHL